uniref:RadC-like JAB domain-containing protein n=1 Tax=Candidatus Kentrum sp. TUN TaxID=2126343 RepID=A0A450ZVN3_9GAMM|nr:MAG: RadC-like JAB domain-containing protein [Candidatus Kentron sp. TUN]VFK57808.1 MAG: RadC-like JAB domain-containing protein [Candidatus Kentron sp. TUN]VFK62307.1 MAG: RadC-like JAB domain-containing protein [Candidatus Kentron sp. TUN]
MGDYKAILETTTTTTRLEIRKNLPKQEATVELTKEQKIPIDQPADLFPIMQTVLRRENKSGRRKEHFWVVGLRSDNRILYIELVSFGGASTTIVNPIEVYQLAIVNKSYRIMLVHNHTDGALKPSESDKEITRILIEGGKLLNIEVLDHLIISEDSYFSFLEEGLIEPDW